MAVLVAAGAVLAVRHGPATPFTGVSYAPPINANGAALWATMVFAFGGPEALAFLRGEVKGGVAKIVKVLAVVGVFLAGAYGAGTTAILAILPAQEVSRLAGVPEAIRQSLGRLGLGALSPGALILLAGSMLGAYSAWFGIAARLPMVIGADGGLPAALARRGERSGAPTTALLVQTLAVIALITLGQAGASVKAAYDFLISMSVISYTLPFVFLFIVYLKVQGSPRTAGAWTPPGARLGRLVGCVGLAITISAIGCTLVPSPEVTDKVVADVKLVVACAALILSGLLVRVLTDWRRSAVARRAAVQGP
jgi:amino acid transporter